MDQKITPVVDTFLEIVQIDSPTGHEEKMTEYVQKRLTALGLNPITDVEGNVYAHLEGDSNMEPIFLNAHLDTVTPGNGVKPTLGEDGWIRADGTTVLGADNKTAVAGILESAQKLIDSSVPHRPIDIFFTVSEEGNSHGAIGFNYDLLKSKKGYAFDITDKKFGTIFISAPFYNRLLINLSGKSGHAKSPEEAINVLPVFIKAMSQLPLGRFSPNTVVNIGTINGGTAANAIPGQLSLVGEVRSSIEEELENVTQEYKTKFESSSKDSGVKVKFEALRENPGYKIDSNDSFLQETISLLKKFGVEPTMEDSFGCADANFFATHGLTTLNISDGTLASHTTEERVNINNLNKLVDLIFFLATN